MQLCTWPSERGAPSPDGRFAGGSSSPELDRLRKGVPPGTMPSIDAALGGCCCVQF